jgi:outer membrane immunogenic protein
MIDLHWRFHMRLLVLTALGALSAATPALADDSTSGTGNGARVELRTGLAWPDGQAAKGEIGVAGGYDVPVGSNLFFGVEQSIDKTLASGQKVRWGTSGRVGAHVGANDKLYVSGGYAYGKGADAPTVGAGWEHGFGNKVYGKVEYKKFLNEDGVKNSNAALVGVGVHF